MKRITLILFVLFVVIGQSFAQSKKLIRTYSVTEKIETTIKYADGVEVKRYVSEQTGFDSNGEWIELIDYNSKGDIKSHETRQFVKGVLVTKMKDVRIPKSEGKVKYERSTFQYVKGNVVMKESFDKGNTLIKRTVYAYNKFGDLELETKMDGEGIIKKRIAYQYNDRGFRSEKQISNGQDEVVEIKLYAYE